jgi:hypothetical protein
MGKGVVKTPAFMRGDEANPFVIQYTYQPVNLYIFLSVNVERYIIINSKCKLQSGEKVVEFETKRVIIEGEHRFVIVEKGTDKILDNAQGYGYKTAQGAHKAGWYKFQKGHEKINSEKAEARRFWKLHSDIKQEVVEMLECNVKEICRGELTVAEILTDLEKYYGFVFPKSVIKYME